MADYTPFTNFYIPRLKANEEGLTQLKLSQRGIDDEAAESLTVALKTNTNIQRIILEEPLVGDKALDSFCRLFRENATVEVFELSGDNCVSDAGVRELTNCLLVNGSLTNVLVGSQSASREALDELQLICSWNREPPALKDVLVSLSRRIEGNNPSCRVNLSEVLPSGAHFPYTLQSARLLSGLLKTDTAVTELDLSHNFQGDEAADILTRALADHPVLELRMNGNQITDRGAQAMAHNLVRNTTLTTLSLHDNVIGDAGADAFIELAKVNPTISHIVVERNNITQNKKHEVIFALLLNAQPLKLKRLYQDLCLNNSTIQTLILDGDSQGCGGEPSNRATVSSAKRLNDISCRVLKSCLEFNTSVRTVRLLNNRIGNDGASLLAELLLRNQTITCLDLQGNLIGSNGVSSFVAVLKMNRSCTMLNLSKQTPQLSDSDLSELKLLLDLNAEPMCLKSLVPLLHKNDPSVTVVDLTASDATSNPSQLTCTIIASALASNTHITELNLSYNPQLVGRGLDSILSVLTTSPCPPIQTLNLSHMSLSNSEATTLLTELLSKSTTLTNLDLSGNSISDIEPWIELLLEKNNTLTAVNLSNSTVELDETLLAELNVCNFTFLRRLVAVSGLSGFEV
ncbi:hypothetical protein DIPPA_52436 [Diplonema papillatum]|nr:hypothetical protein DIPPA_52436 [Diplonema papillatum]